MGWREGLAMARREDLTVGTLMAELAQVYGDSPLIQESGGGLRLTYREAAQRVARQAAAIRPKIQRGDRVVIAVPNGYLLFLLCLAVAQAGGVAVPVNPKMSQVEIDHVVSDSGAALILTDDPADAAPDGAATPDSHGPPDAAAVDVAAVDVAAVAVEPNDLAILFYTSGTTGKPKGAELTHPALTRPVPGLVRAGMLRQFHRDDAVTAMHV